MLRFEGQTSAGSALPREDFVPLKNVTLHILDWAGVSTPVATLGGRSGKRSTSAAPIRPPSTVPPMRSSERATKIIQENRDTLVRLADALLEHESLDGVQIRRIVAGLTLEDDEAPATVSTEEQPQLKEPVQRPLKPILPPITGSTPATA